MNNRLTILGLSSSCQRQLSGGAERLDVIEMYDRVRVIGGESAGQRGTVVAIDRDSPGGVTRITYGVRLDGTARVCAVAEEELAGTGETAMPFAFGEVVRIVETDDPDGRW